MPENTQQLNVLSLFAGIEGLGLGLERAGMTVVGQVEINPASRAVLEKHYPEVPRHDDVRTAAEWWRSVPRPRVDVVCGGFPCQPFSPAGLQRGVADERWGWPWFADVVRAVRPRYVVVENVPALVRHSDAFGWVLADLAELGFDAEWDVLSACSVGAPHPRRRLYLVAYPAGTGLQGLHEAGRRVDLQPVTPNVWRDWPSEPAVARVDYGVPRRLVRDEIHALGDAVVPQVAEFVGALIVNHAASVEVDQFYPVVVGGVSDGVGVGSPVAADQLDTSGSECLPGCCLDFGERSVCSSGGEDRECRHVRTIAAGISEVNTPADPVSLGAVS